MSGLWDDFQAPQKDCKKRNSHLTKSESTTKNVDVDKSAEESGCEWGFGRRDGQIGDGELDAQVTDSSKFIPIYEKYLEDKHTFISNEPPTKNHHMYGNNPPRAIREWFGNEGHDFVVKTDQPKESEYICTLDLPIDDHDFTITSDIHNKKQLAVDEVCLLACKLLDKCQLLYSWQYGEKEDSDRKRRIVEANKEDDIELDSAGSAKRHCDKRHTSKAKVNTYESLLDDWKALNNCILQLKAKLVKLDLSVTKNQNNSNTKSLGSNKDEVLIIAKSSDSDESEVDPLDEFMFSLERKTELNKDEKIEKSRIKTEIFRLEREQNEVSRLIELAKPKFDLNKKCPGGQILSKGGREKKES